MAALLVWCSTIIDELSAILCSRCACMSVLMGIEVKGDSLLFVSVNAHIPIVIRIYL